MSKCEAAQQGDEMACGACGLRWDTNDEAPPACGKAVATVSGKVDMSAALALLKQTGEARAGLVHQANGAPTKGYTRPPAGTWPDTVERHDIPPPAPRTRAEDARAAGAPVFGKSARQAGRSTASEAWMIDAVARGAVVLSMLPAPGPHVLAFGPWRMPSELPEEAAFKMSDALNAHLSQGCSVCEISPDAVREAYRELLAYLGQA